MILSLLLAAFFSLRSAPSTPTTLVLDGKILAQNARAIAAKNDPNKIKALNELVQKADNVLKAGRLYSVMQKKQLPPSGDKHDYMSQGPYWWPDPSKPDGKPYIRKDGQRNPEINGITDHDQLHDLIEDSELMSLAYYFTQKEKYAQHAALLLETWFLNSDTKMNPHLNYGQGIPGITEGRGIGIIDSRGLYMVIDAAILLQDSKSWSAKDHAALKSWFSEYLTWLTESPIGRDEADEHNNHGTYYDVQVVASALFCGRNEVAKKQLETTKARLASQLQADGSQPHELARTLSWNYTNMNLYGFMILARLAEHVDVDLWKYETADGKGIHKAVDWLVPYAKKEKDWTYNQIKDRSFDNTYSIFGKASKEYNNPIYGSLAGERSFLEVLTN
ncbi:alginate lyase family protein [Persicitalea sp.]|uniref:alginate lyase family protein n=1 Tax=Persicitalea sp. TaxID=3100273 RepID=UPI0035942C5D